MKPQAIDSATRRSGISRRQFVRASAAVGAALGVARLAPRALAGPPRDDLVSRSATQIARLLRNRELTATDAVTIFLARIDAVNPRINAAVASCRERALQEAADCDAIAAAGRFKGPLHGVPFTVTDSFDTAGVVSTGGTLGRKDFVPGTDATIVARLRAAGAILLGKTNTSEFTLSGSGTTNLVYGVTRNPYDPRYQPGGSSGGAGAIVAAGGAAFDIGCDYDGAIRGPAFATGLAGLKPTLGRVPRTGHIIGPGGPFDSLLDAGPLVRRVEDIALILPIIMGPDSSDAAMAPVPLGDYTRVNLTRLRLAFHNTTGAQPPTAEIQALTRKCAAYFANLGCGVTEDRPPKLKQLDELRQRFAAADGRAFLRRALNKHGTTRASAGLQLDGHAVSSAELTELCEQIDAIRSEQLHWFESYDLIVCPASAGAPAALDETPPGGRDPTARVGTGGHTSGYNLAGWPAGVVRAGTSTAVPGLPLGIQLVARPWCDHIVIAAMAHIEKQTGGWRMPNR